jgi:hypothetical protein
MKTNQTITFDTLNGHYLTSGEIINEEYLCEAITMWLMNTQKLYNRLSSKRNKTTSIIWEAFADLVNNHIQSEHRGFECSSNQLKKWLNTYGKGYNTLTAAIEEIDAERE